MTARDAARRELSKIAASPLSRRLQDTRLLSRVKHSTFVPYGTNIDLIAHIQHYQQALFMHDGDDAIMCKIFPSSLGKVALAWFHKLEPYTIKSWKQLSEEFTTWFLTSQTTPKTFEVLSSMKQGPGYAKKFWEAFNEIENRSCSRVFPE